MKISIAVASHKGKVREKNEDSFYISLSSVYGEERESENIIFEDVCELNSRVIFGVFDGMGGLQNGEFASNSAVTRLKELDYSNKSGTLSDYILDINSYVCKQMRSINKKIGSTAVIISFENEKYELANIGDSRCYIFRNAVLKQISEDHTEVAILKKMKMDEVTYFNEINYNWSNILTQYLGIFEEEFQIEPFVDLGDMRPGDIFLLCSDGLTSMIADEELCKELSYEKSLIEKRDALLEKALENGGFDNITFILVQVL